MAQRYKYGVRPETEACANCEHFRQHYILDSMGRWEGFIPITEGHCIFRRVKNRKVYDCCEHFEKERGE